MFSAGLSDVPPGTMQYSEVSMMSGNCNLCTRTTEITSAGKDWLEFGDYTYRKCN